MKLHGNLEIDKLFICVLCSSPFLPYCSASEWLRHGIPERLGLLLGLHRLNSFRSSPTMLTPSVDPFYLSAVSSLDEGGSTHGCPGAWGVKMWQGWQTGECGQTFVVSRLRPMRLSWSLGKLVSQEAHCKLIIVLLCGIHAGLCCERGEYPCLLLYTRK